MSRAQQDSVIDDDEETCPLCIEEFDLSDKNFRPCPCGYQICQFCFNSLKTTYEKSTCPNCRRIYDDKTIQYKIPTAEEFKLDQQNKNRKQAAAKRKETEKREVETSSRRNLAGVRVKQQNLVYVIGLVPSLKDENSLLQTLRGPEYFGQYGEIDKIVVSKAKPGASNQGIGVYVTFAKKEDAALCISMVDGSMNGDRVLRAQFGTTKYCSAYLRGEVCNNKNCTFLHETGEDGHNSTIQNEPSTSKPIQRMSYPTPITQSILTNRPLLPNTQALPSTSQPMHRQNSKEESNSRKGSTDASALPSTASWGSANIPVTRIRRTSQAASRSSPSPQTSNAALVAPQKVEDSKRDDSPTPPMTSQPQSQLSATPSVQALVPQISNEEPSPVSSRHASPKQQNMSNATLDRLIANVCSPDFRFVFDDSAFTVEEQEAIERYPSMIDPYGGAKRRLMREKDAAERAKVEAETLAKVHAQSQIETEPASMADLIEEETYESGSLALGGEPEENSRSLAARNAIQRPSQQVSVNSSLHDQFSNLNINPRSLTPQQRQQLALLNSANVAQAPGLGQQTTQAFSNASFDNDQRSGLFQNQPQYDPTHGHARQSSRYSFVNESSKSNAAPRFSGQQQQQQQHSLTAPQHFYSSGAQGPPPGLKTAGTPPISGGGMFAQGYGFTSNINAGFGNSKDVNSDMLMRGRSGTNSGHDISKRGGVVDLADPSVLQARLHQGGAGSGQGLFGGQNQDDLDFPPLVPLSTLSEESQIVKSRVHPAQSLQDFTLRSSTPKLPPGLSLPHAHPLSSFDLAVSGLSQKSKTTVGTPGPVAPAVPILPIGPRANTPKLKQKMPPVRNDKASNEADEVGQMPSISASNLEQHETATSVSPLQNPTEPTTKDEMNLSVDTLLNSATATGSKVKAISEDETALPSVEQNLSPVDHARHLLHTLPETVGIVDAAVTPTTKPESRIGSPAVNMTPNLPPFVVATPSIISSRPNTPATAVSRASDSSAATRPRTIRVTTSMILKADTTPASATTERSSGPGPYSAKQHSRQPSLSSISRSRPSTPAISDHGFSYDVSRAGSPPPSIVGSATERTKTKAQLRKERKAKGREPSESKDDSSIVSAPALVEEIAPIISRQKKKKRATQDRSTVEDDPQAVTPEKKDPEKFAASESTQPEKKEQSTKAGKQPKLLITLKEAMARTAIPITPAKAVKVDDKKISPVQAFEGDDHVTTESEQAPKQSYTLNNLIADASKLDDPGAFQKLLYEKLSTVQKLLSEVLGKPLDPAGALFTPPPLTSYRLPPDQRKGAEYLDANGYTQSSPFGEIYLTNKERKTLQVGQEVRLSDPNRPGDLLKRVMITPNGTIYRHLSQDEEDRVLELELRRAENEREFGKVGKVEPKALEENDFINILGGLEDSLGPGAAKHGVSWVTSEGEEGGLMTDEEVGYGDSDNLSDGTDDLAMLVAGYHAARALGVGLPGAVSNNNATTSVAKKDSTAPPSTTIGTELNVRAFLPHNYRSMGPAQLRKAVKEATAEMERTKKEMETMEKKSAKKSKEAARWRDSLQRECVQKESVKGAGSEGSPAQ